MNVKKQDEFVVAGPREDWYRRCLDAMERAGFKKVDANQALSQITGHFRRWPKPVGRLEISLLPAGDDRTHCMITSVCRTDISAAFGNPNIQLLNIFKRNLTTES